MNFIDTLYPNVQLTEHFLHFFFHERNAIPVGPIGDLLSREQSGGDGIWLSGEGGRDDELQAVMFVLVSSLGPVT